LALSALCLTHRVRNSLERVHRSRRIALSAHRWPLENSPTTLATTEILIWLGLFTALAIDILIAVKQLIDALLIN